MSDGVYTQTPTPKNGDAACALCGGVLDPVQTLWSRTGMHYGCEQVARRRLAENRMVAP